MSPENLVFDPTPDVALSRQALGWLVRLNRRCVSVAEANALRRWCKRSAAHAQAWAEAARLWRLLLPAAQAVARRAGRCKTPRHRHSFNSLHGRPRSHHRIRSFK